MNMKTRPHKKSTTQEKMNGLMSALSRRVDAIYPSKEALEKRLAEKKPLSLYLGVDPTSEHLHFGHLIPLLILRDFQKYGHSIILLIGDFTARIGDPTDKSAARQPLTASQVKKNMTTFKKQASRIISFSGKNPARFMQNAKWLGKMTFENVIDLASRVTVQQMIERDMFQERLKAGRPISLHEFMYPLMQGYDSVAMKVDAEVGGTDQIFNMMMGREFSREMLKKEKFVLAGKLLVNPSTGKKVSKSEGGLINLDDSPKDVFGKVMALPDEAVFLFARLSTDMDIAAIEELEEKTRSGQMNPRDAKLTIAHAATTLLFSEKIAGKEQDVFISTFSKKEGGAQGACVFKVSYGAMTIVDVVVATGALKSKGEAWRLIEQGGCEYDKKKISNPRDSVHVKKGDIVKVGKHAFYRVG